MTPRKFDRYMVALGIGTHPKLVDLTDSEFRAHVVGVLAIAAMSPVRGRLLVGQRPARPIHIAVAAGVPERVAASAMVKLEESGVLEPDEDHGCLRVHDWDDMNPSPGAERTRRWRDGRRDAETSQEHHSDDHAPVTGSSPEVEEEEEVERKKVNTNAELRSAVLECFGYWQEQCGHPNAKLTTDREAKVKARLREGYTVQEIRQAINGAARGAWQDESGKRFDDLELICRKGSKLEDFMQRANGRTLSIVRPGKESPSDLLRALAADDDVIEGTVA